MLATVSVFTLILARPHNVSAQFPGEGKVLQTLKKERPFLFPKERVAMIKQAIAEDPVAARTWERVLAFADEVLTMPPSKYELRDGVRLLYVCKEALERIRALGLVFLITNEKPYADRAWAELEAVSNFKNWNPGHYLDVGEMTHAVGIGYDWLYDQWTPAQRGLLVKALDEKGMQPSLQRYSASQGWHTRNHNWNQVVNGGLVVGALAIADTKPEISASILNSAYKSIQLPMKAYEPDGATWEGPSYWDYGSRYNVHLLDAFETALGTDFGLSEVGAFKESGDYQIYLSGTDLQAFDFGDSGLGPLSAAQHMWMGRKFNIPRYSWFRYNALANGQNGDVLDLIWFDGSAKSYDIKQMPLDRAFGGNDVGSMRDTWTNGKGFVVGIEGGKNNALSHRHLDLGSFILEGAGIRWIIDSGRESAVYHRSQNGAESRWDFYRLRTEGHNTYVLNLDKDGGNQDRTGSARFVSFDSQPDKVEAVLDISKAYPLAKTLTRKFTLVRGKSFTITDMIDLTQSADLRSFFHTKAAVEISGDKRKAILKQGGGEMRMEITKPASAGFAVVPAKPGKASPQLDFQEQNEDMRKLMIQINPATKTEIEVVFTMLVEPVASIGDNHKSSMGKSPAGNFQFSRNAGQVMLYVPHSERLRVTLTDIQGREVASLVNSSGRGWYPVDLSGKVTGMYLLAIKGMGDQLAQPLVLH